MKRFSVITILFLMLCSLACKDKMPGPVAHREEAIKEIYTCSMHPEVIRDQPGNCPICGMALVRKESGAQKINGVSLNDLLKPTNEFVISNIGTTTITKEDAFIEIPALGSIGYDTRAVGNISATISGRIEKLYIHYRYQHINKGQLIMDIYSPEMLTAQQNLLFLINNDAGNSSFIEAAKEKLLLLGMSSKQLQEVIDLKKPVYTISLYSNFTGHIHEAGDAKMNLPAGTMKDIAVLTDELPIKEGMYVQKGQTVFSVFNPAKAWALLNIYAENQELVTVGNVVRIVPETAPEKNFRAAISFIEPFYRIDGKTVTARVYFDNSQSRIPIGSQVRATVFGNSKAAWWLPKAAVISLGLEKIVLLKAEGGFKAHKIKTGILYNNKIQVLQGLGITDSVALNAQYLMDSESFIKIN